MNKKNHKNITPGAGEDTEHQAILLGRNYWFSVLFSLSDCCGMCVAFGSLRVCFACGEVIMIEALACEWWQRD